MPESITSSSELRGFVADNTGRRKIDTEASLELHIRAATQIDLLTQELAELERRLADARSAADNQPRHSPPAQAATDEDATSSAMMLLRNAQAAADETLAEAAQLRARAAAELADAEAQARVRADNAVAEAVANAERSVAEARMRADAVLSDARAQAQQIVEHAHGEADTLRRANDTARDRAEYIQRQFLDRAHNAQREADALADFSRQIVSFAETEFVPSFDGAPPAAEASPDALTDTAGSGDEAAPAAVDSTEGAWSATDTTGEAERDADVVAAATEPTTAANEAPAMDTPSPVASSLPDPPAPRESEDFESHLTLVADEPDATLPPPPPPPPPALDQQPEESAPTDVLPPPPSADILDLTEEQLANVLEGTSIDDELFDDEVIDLTEDADATSDGFQFFGRD